MICFFTLQFVSTDAAQGYGASLAATRAKALPAETPEAAGPGHSGYPLVTIPLDKQYVPVVRNNRTVSYKTAYFGKVSLGSPQQDFTVLFDTGSGHFFLPSATCDTETCRRHRRYDARASSTALEIDHEGREVGENATGRDQVAVAYGTGEIVGEFVWETVCLGGQQGPDCIQMRVVLATEMTTEPFGTFEFDGVLGLGLEGLAVDPEFSFFGQLFKLHNLTDARFGYFLSRTDELPSEITLGGHDERRMASALQWAPVHRPELGHWQLRIRSVTAGNETLSVCETGDCVAIADTGTSLLGVPRQASQRLHWLLARKVPDDPDEIDCRNFPGPDLTFDLGDGVKLTLGPEDYSRPTAMRVLQNKTGGSQVICRASLLPVDGDAEVLGPKAWILGEPLLRKYYTVYDYPRRRVGFSLAAQPGEEEAARAAAGARRHTVYGAPPAALPTPSVVVV